MPTIKSINPSTYQLLGEVEISSRKEIEEKIRLAKSAQKEWQSIGLAKRIEYLQKALSEFKSQKTEFTLLESQEMGMPINEANPDFDQSLDYANWYFENAATHLSPETTFENSTEIHQVFYEPIGVAAVILPWNFPMGNFIWGTIQSLIAGNTVILKDSEEIPLCGKFIEEIFTKNLPKGVFNEIYGDGETAKILLEQDINMISFTGSTKTGKSIYETAGKKIIKALMELGGSAPGIIFEDADLDLAIPNVCMARLLNCGQSCDGLKRLIVHESIYEKVVEKIAENFSNKKIGSAEDAKTEIGPLVAKRQLDLLVSQLEDAKAKGAKIITGGNSLETKIGGAFFEPTVVTNVTTETDPAKGMRIWTEEVFGPILPIVKFKTEEEALKLGNETPYGLGAYIFTSDKERADRLANSIQSGMVSLNNANYIMPFNPFGGYKNSGFGRQHGKYGFHEVTQIKIVARNKSN